MTNFKTHQGLVIEDLKQYVSDWLVNKNDPQIWIGCDSQAHGKAIHYAVTICLYEKGKGAHVISKKINDNNKRQSNGKRSVEDGTNLIRLWEEVKYSVETADELKNLGVKITIHVDYNSKPNEVSNQLYDSGIGFALSKGYDAVGKPWAIASTYAADRECR